MSFWLTIHYLKPRVLSFFNIGQIECLKTIPVYKFTLHYMIMINATGLW